MITLYSGTPGSGKSLHSAKLIYEWLVVERKNVIANFDVNRKIFLYNSNEIKKSEKDKVRQVKIQNKKYRNLPIVVTYYKPKRRNTGKFFYFGDDVINPKVLVQYAKKHHKPGREKQTLLVFDECSSDDLFNNRTWQNKGRNDWITFFRQHRKLGFEIIFIAQSDKLIDKAMKAFVEYEVKHRKANNYKAFGRLLGFFSGGALFFAIEYWYGVREKISTTMFRYDKYLGDFYDTYKVF